MCSSPQATGRRHTFGLEERSRHGRRRRRSRREFRDRQPLDHGAELIDSQDERERVAELNSCRQARQSFNGVCRGSKVPRHRTRSAVPDSWQRQYQLAFALEFKPGRV